MDSGPRPDGAAGYMGLVVNEIFAQGDDMAAPPTFDYIELYNSGPSPISLDGFTISDGDMRDPRDPLPPGLTLAPGEYFVIVVEPPAEMPGTLYMTGPDCPVPNLAAGTRCSHMSFGLSGGGGDTFRLFDAAGNEVASGVWPMGTPADETQSWCRLTPDADFGPCEQTPGFMNAAVGGAVDAGPRTDSGMTPGQDAGPPVDAGASPLGNLQITEIYPFGGDIAGGPGQDYVELYNPGPSPVSLDGLSFLDGDTAHTPDPFPSGTTIQPGGYLLVVVDLPVGAGDCGVGAVPGTTCVASDDGLSGSNGDVANIVTATGVVLLTSGMYMGTSAPPTPQSWCATGPMTFTLCTPTPGAANTVTGNDAGMTTPTDAGMDGGLTMMGSDAGGTQLRNLQITEIYPFDNDDDGGPDLDYIELYNPGPDPVSLDGLAFVDGDSTNTPDPFPAGTTIPPGGYLLVVVNLTGAPADCGVGAPSGTVCVSSDDGLSGTNGDVANVVTATRSVLLTSGMFEGRMTTNLSMPQSWCVTGPMSFTLCAPTPGRPNGGASDAGMTGADAFVAPTVADLVITELFAFGDNNAAPPTYDYVELYNPTSAPISLVGYAFVDSGTPPEDFPVGAVVPPMGYFLVVIENLAAVPIGELRSGTSCLASVPASVSCTGSARGLSGSGGDTANVIVSGDITRTPVVSAVWPAASADAGVPRAMGTQSWCRLTPAGSFQACTQTPGLPNAP